MKSQNSNPLQPKWIIVAAIGTLGAGAIVGAHAQTDADTLPAPPKMAEPGRQHGIDSTARRPRPENRGNDDFDGNEEMAPPPEDGQRGAFGAQDDRPAPPQAGRDDFGPPPIEGPEGFGPPGVNGPQQGAPPSGFSLRKAAETAEVAERGLDRAYHIAGQTSAAGKLSGQARELFEQSHDNYAAALKAYASKSYRKSAILADASEHLSKAALVLSHPEEPAGPTGWATPPRMAVVKKNVEEERISMSLNRAYRELQKPLENKTGAVSKLLGSARTFYKTAAASFTAKDFGAARSNAVAADELIQAAHRLSDISEA